MLNNCSIRSICTIVLITLVAAQNVPTSPCPEYFQYRYDGTKWIGVIQVPPPGIGQSLVLKVDMSLSDRLPNRHPGSLALFTTREEALQRIVQQQPIQYRVDFPIPSPLPKLTQILYNDRTICQGPLEQTPVVTSLNLEHKLNSHLTYGNNAINNGPQIQVPQQQPQYPQQQPQYPQQQPQVPQQQPQYPQQQPQYPVQSQPMPKPQPPPTQQPQQPLQSQAQPIPQQPPQQQPTSQPTSSSTTSQSTEEVCGRIDPKYNYRPLAYGGVEIARGTWPWLAAVYRSSREALKFQCGGTLINNKAVVTAAHCFFNSRTRLRNSDILVYLGRYNIDNYNEPGLSIPTVSNIYVHHDYRADSTALDADIAVITFSQQITYTEFIRPICWELSSTSVEGQTGYVVGWGRSESSQLTATPRRVSAEIVSESDCLRSQDAFVSLTSKRTLCAGNKDGTGPCNGDSGSGLMVQNGDRWTLRGIVSTALSDPISNVCNLKEYVVYCDATKFTKWIRSVLT